MASIHLLQNVWYHLANIFSLGMSDGLAFLRKKISVEKGRISVKVASLGRGRELYPHLAVTEANEQAASDYVPRPYAGRVVAFCPKANFLGQGDADFGWGDVVRDGLSVCTLPFYPKAMLVDPFAKSLAERFNQYLAEAPLQGAPVDDLVGEINGVLEAAQEVHP
jgi:hypothetical protein